MSSKSDFTLPESVMPYVNEIAERLASGHAAVMIGAGFSRNAVKVVPSAPDFPTWHDLSDCLYEKLHGCKPTDATHHYLSPLKLADEVRAAFGSPVLDQLVRAEIPDEQHEPSELHVEILKLPWTDVFTVNYDTLLERASKKVAERRYDLVLCEQDLVVTSQPRIVKLHGSLPSTRPFVLSEEDYRRYSQEQAPFVNTVQQALLENTLCLIGFSGEDPNFQQWLGWVRDNLGPNSPYVYLVGILSLTAAQRQLLQMRNVIPVDLGCGSSGDNDHTAALSAFFRHLRNAVQTTKEAVTWPDPRQMWTKRTGSVEELTSKWRNQRLAYPNWVVPPDKSREDLYYQLLVEQFGTAFLSAESPVPASSSDLELLYELNWVLQHALLPIFNHLIPAYRRILQRYNPFPMVLDSQPAVVTPEFPGDEQLHWSELSTKWIDLSIAVLRWCREEGQDDDWRSADGILDKVQQHLSPQQLAFWHHERCLKALFEFDVPLLKQRLNAWPKNNSLPFAEVKRAALMAEIGQLPEAQLILEEALASIRVSQHLVPVTSDYGLVSQEAHAMFLLHQVYACRQFSERQPQRRAASQHSFRDRWIELKRFQCDPWKELELFEARLQSRTPNRPLAQRRRTFDIGRISETFSLGSADDKPRCGYEFLRWCEEAAVPSCLRRLDIAQKQTKLSATAIGQYSWYWAVTSILRTGQSETADSALPRSGLVVYSSVAIDEWVTRLLALFERLRPQLYQGDQGQPTDLSLRAVRLVPEILSRLCTKCSEKQREMIFRFLMGLYENPIIYEGAANLTTRLLGSFSEAELVAHMPTLVNACVFTSDNALLKEAYVEPFLCLASRRGPLQQSTRPAFEAEAIAKLLDLAESGTDAQRFRACLRLACLYDWGLLGPDRTNRFATALWSRRDADGFPADTKFGRSSFLGLPAPRGTNAVDLFREYVQKAQIPGTLPVLYQFAVDGVTVEITRGDIPLCGDILRATKRSGGHGHVDWTVAEAVSLFGKLLSWWNTGKEYLRRPSVEEPFDIRREFLARYANLVRMLASVVGPRLIGCSDENLLGALRQLLGELDEYGVSGLQAWAGCAPALPDTTRSVAERVRRNLSSSDRDRVEDAVEAAMILLSAEAEAPAPGNAALGCLVTQQVLWRRELALDHILGRMALLTRDSPRCLTSEMMSDLLLGLEGLLVDSDPRDAKLSEDECATRLGYRRNAAALASGLYVHCVQAGEQMPEVLLRWQKVCLDPEEFAEIRTAWSSGSSANAAPRTTPPEPSLED